MAQDRRIADSLEAIYNANAYNSDDLLFILRDLASYHPDPDKMFFYSEELLKVADPIEHSEFVFDAYLEKGNAQRLRGNIPEALESYFNAAEMTNNNSDLGTITISIAGAYLIIGSNDLALDYYSSAIDILRVENDSTNLASALLNAGFVYYSTNVLDSALLLYKESGDIFRLLNSEIGLAYTTGNIGQVHKQLGNYEVSELNLINSIEMLTDLGDLYPISEYYLDLSDIYYYRGENQKSLEYAKQSLSYAHQFELKEIISEANLKISKIYEKLGQPEMSFSYYKDHIIYRDSINNIAAIQQMAELRTEYEVAQKQAEVDLLTKEAEIADLQDKRQKWVIFGIALSLFLVGALAISSYRRYRFVQATNLLVESEKNRSDELLLNILPQETASELKQSGSVKARKIENVTVLFTDFIDFTKLAEHAAPEHIIKSLDYYFKRFDEITTKYNLEKIKTIGDSFMCAGGLHTGSTQAKDVINAGLEMVKVVEEVKASHDDITHYDIRIGVHTGPVVAGIVGTKKWQYDIWGDTVNIASGMETNSSAGRINISEQTYNKIKDDFNTEFRGEKRIKNRGFVKMYFVS